MARQRSPNRDKAFDIYKSHGGDITNREIAKLLDISEKTVGGWKCKDKWDDKLNGVLQKDKRSTLKEKKSTSKKKGAPKGNKNAVGNSGGSPPKGNKNAETHGFFSKYLPEDTLEIMKEIETRSPIDMLWDNIMIQYTAIIRAQRIMYVRDKEDITKNMKKERITDNSEEREWEFQYAWDKQANFLQAQSRAISELRSSIKSYLELEGLNKEKSKAGITDWKAAVQAIAKRREKKKQQEEVNSNG